LSDAADCDQDSEKNELAQPENIDHPFQPVRSARDHHQAGVAGRLDCPFAYVLCALAAGRNPAAMTQLVGRILRQPQVAKTGREALDACYVLCHDARTGEVVRAIKKSLEDEGMGDLALTVSDGETASTEQQEVRQTRRAGFAGLRLFVPKVTWVEGDRRRELDYESDILSRVAWENVDLAALARDWAPDDPYAMSERFDVDLSILARGGVLRDRNVKGRWPPGPRPPGARAARPRAECLAGGSGSIPSSPPARQRCSETRLAGSSAALIERLRIDIERERDRLAEAAFLALVAEGRVEFALRADAADYELPSEATLMLPGKAEQLPIMREDHRPAEKSLLEPALRTPDMNNYELACAGYLDSHRHCAGGTRTWRNRSTACRAGSEHRSIPLRLRLRGRERCEKMCCSKPRLDLVGSRHALKQALLEGFRRVQRKRTSAPVNSHWKGLGRHELRATCCSTRRRGGGMRCRIGTFILNRSSSLQRVIKTPHPPCKERIASLNGR
jgi:type III restriction enzyme